MNIFLMRIKLYIIALRTHLPLIPFWGIKVACIRRISFDYTSDRFAVTISIRRMEQKETIHMNSSQISSLPWLGGLGKTIDLYLLDLLMDGVAKSAFRKVDDLVISHLIKSDIPHIETPDGALCIVDHVYDDHKNKILFLIRGEIDDEMFNYRVGSIDNEVFRTMVEEYDSERVVELKDKIIKTLYYDPELQGYTTQRKIVKLVVIHKQEKKAMSQFIA